MSRYVRLGAMVVCSAALSFLGNSHAYGQAVRTWVGGDGAWTDGAGDASWSPADEPDPNEIANFNTNNVIELGSSNAVDGLIMSASSELHLNDNLLNVTGATTLTGAGTRLEVVAGSATLAGEDITINSGATLFIDGGDVSSAGPAGNSIVSIAAGGTLSGNGRVAMQDALAAATTLINNNGVIMANNPVQLVITPPSPATLHLTATDADARIDLDGSGESGIVTVSRNQTLDIDLPLADIFNGEITMAQASKLDMGAAWTMGANSIMNINNGATGGLGGAPAGVATIGGALLLQTAGTITVLDNDGTLKFEAPFTMNAGDLVNNGLVVFDSTSVIGAGGANLTMPTTASSLTVAANRTVTINQNNFNMDGANTPTNVITVEAGGNLSIATTDYDPDQATNAFDGTITLNSGAITVTSSDAEFVMDGTLNINRTTAAVPLWSSNSEPLDIGNDIGVLDADVNIGGTGSSQINAQVDFNSDADVNIAAGATLQFGSSTTVNFNTVNGVNNAEFTGAGEISFSGPVNVNEAVKLDMVGGTVDLDGNDGVGDFINIDAPLIINAATMSSFGSVNGVGVNTLDINSNVGTGSLTVNLDNPADEWTLNAAGVMNLVNDAGGGTLLAGSDVNINGTVNVTGGMGTTARIDLAGTINVAAASALTLAGGSLADPNRLEGGTINGPGTFAVATNRGLRGFGTINTTVNYAGSAELLADDGELTVNANVIDAGTIGAADADGVLNVVNAWNTTSIDNVFIIGGELKGGTVTVANANGIQGYGTISSRLINNSKIVATDGTTLLVQTAGNDNDWDGAGNTGRLEALSGDLEMVDTTGPVPPVRTFGGTVRAIDGHQVFANGFALDFLPGSALELGGESTYRASSSTDIGGTVTIGPGADATIQVANNFFLTFETGSATTLNGDVTLINNNIIIEPGAVFSGPGALVVPDGSHLVADNQAEIGVLLNLDGAFRPGNSNGIGRVELLDMQMTETSELFVELTGTGLNQFDRLVADGDVIVDGYLNIDVDDISPGVPFVPVLGNTFNIITGTTVTGTFDVADVSGMPAGMAFHINYLPNAVQLQVVSKPFFSADFDDDGDVDATDLQIWDGAFKLNQLGDADGDNDTDGRDFLAWQRQLGSKPAVAVAAVVPEPNGLAIAFGVVAMLAYVSRRDRERQQRRHDLARVRRRRAG